MRRPRDYSSYHPIRLDPEEAQCPMCQGELSRGYNGVRYVAGLKERLEILYTVKRCDRKTCPVVFPQFLRSRVLPGYEYGLDVIAFIGHHRLGDHRPFCAIAEVLREQHHVQISNREVEYLFTQYVALVSTPVAKDPARLEKLRGQGRIILSLDAAQPEPDRESLWIFRDTLSGEILEGFSCLSIDANGLSAAIEKIKALDIPIVGVISDGQNIILQAVAKALPGVPHQLCQFHFLKDLANPVTALDRELARGLKKELRGLNAFEKAIDPNRPKGPQDPEIKAPKSVTVGAQPPASKPGPGRPRVRVPLRPSDTLAEEAIVRQVCEIMRALLSKSGRYPLQAPGLEMRHHIAQVARSLHDALKKKARCSSNNSLSTSAAL